MSLSLLMTKLHMPVPQPNLVARERLLHRLSEGWQVGRSLTLVSAPAGFGKTTLVTSWLRRLTHLEEVEDHPDVAWLSLDADDSDLRRFCAYLVAALATVRPAFGALEQAVQGKPQVGLSRPEMESFLVELINRVVASPVPLILVLDDCHEVANADVHRALAYLIDHLPRQMHIVLVTRADPPLALARLRTQDRLTEIRTADLRFTLAEAHSFLNQVMGLDLSESQVSVLESRTEGWVAGLQLTAVSLRGRSSGRVRSFITEFSGTHRHVIDYLVEEVLAQQSAALRTFMMETSILAQLSPSLCASVTGRDDAAALLQQLEQRNLFVVPLDESRTWYRYHRLLAEFLRSRLDAEGPEAIQELHRKAATWYKEAGIPGQAVDHLLQAGDIDAAAQLIADAAHDPLTRGQAGIVLRWYESLPEDLVRSHPELAMVYGEALLIAGRGEDAMVYVDIVERSLEGSAQPQDALISQVAAVRAYMAALSGDLAEGISQVQRAMAHLPSDDSFVQAIVMWLLGFMQYFQGDSSDSDRLLDTTIEISQASDNQLIMALAIYVSALMHVLRGNLRTAVQLTERAAGITMAHAPRWQEGPSPAVSMIDQVMAEIARERNDLASARAHIDRSVRLASLWGNAEVLVDSCLLQARICEAMGDVAAMERALREVSRLIAKGDLAPLTIRQVEAHRARLRLYRGDFAAAERWYLEWAAGYEANTSTDSRVMVFVAWTECSTAARIDLARGRFSDVLRLITPLLKQMVTAGWLGVAVELAAIQALAYRAQGDGKAAVASLGRALAWAAPEGYVRSFLDLGPPMAGMVRQMPSEGPYGDYLQSLVMAMDDAQADRPDWAEASVVSSTTAVSMTPGPSGAVVALIEPLSDRELEVLQLIAEGFTNREIAERLYIAVSTVKSHINNLYGKLAVNNRAHAVARAGELHLI